MSRLLLLILFVSAVCAVAVFIDGNWLVGIALVGVSAGLWRAVSLAEAIERDGSSVGD